MDRKVKVAIVGAGSAGLYAMSEVRKQTQDFVLINGGELGTTCARVGCMPSKVAIQVSEDFHRRHVFSRYGLEGKETLSLDTTEAMEYVRDLRDNFVDRVLSNSTDQLPKENFIEGYAEFLDINVLKVGQQTIHADKIILATGSRPYVPTEWQQQFGDKILTTDELFEQESLPPSIAVIGLGVIGLEMGQALHRIGINVTGIDQCQNIANLVDPNVNQVAVDTLQKEFPLWLGHPAVITPIDDMLKVSSGDKDVTVDKVLLSMGRIPNLETLGIDKLSIKRNAKGIPDYNPNTMQIGDLPIFIAGDVSGDRPILHEAGDEGRIAGYNAVHQAITAFQRKTPMNITFCDPNIVSVGKLYSELDLDTTAIGEIKFSIVGRAMIMAKNRGLIRVYACKENGKILGMTMIGPKGENLAHLVAWVIEQKLTVIDLLQMPFYHPVIEEALQAVLYQLVSKIDSPLPAVLSLKPLANHI